MTQEEGALAELAAKLTPGIIRVLTSDRFNPKGWEPNDPHGPSVTHLVDLGLFERRDGRCMFEAFKNSFIVPTPLCLRLRAFLTPPQPESE